jgi:hypothetical protein
VVVTIACLVLGVYAYSRDAAPKRRAFDRNQRLIVQIVTAPTRSVVGGLQYDEAETTVHSTHDLTIPASGEGISVRSVVDGIPIEVTMASAERATDGKSIRLKDVRIFLPIQFQVTDSLGYSQHSFSPGDVTVMDDFHVFPKVPHPHFTIYYTGWGRPHTFLRMRIEPKNRPMPVLDVTGAHAGE